MAASRILTPRGWRKTSRRCTSISKIPARKCPRCHTKYRPQRRWQKFCSRSCRWAINDIRKRSLRPKVKRIGSSEKPFGEIVCPVCKKTFTSTRSTKKYCSHRCYRLRMSRNWMNENRAKGLCYACKTPPIKGGSSWCEKHWLTQLAWRSGLRGRGSWEQLKRLLIKQNRRCPYTGIKLIIGVNASIDHINPRALYPNLVGKINNLEWVDEDVNRAKRMMSRKEFVSMCRKVARRFPTARSLRVR